MTTELIEAGELFANVDERTVSGVLMPWGKLSSRPLADGKGYAAFDRGGLRIPRDISIVSANVEHDRFTPVARATSIEDTEAGAVATFSVARTDDGDALLGLVSEGKLRSLSAEVKNITRADDNPERVTADLVGAAFVNAGAFAGAELFSLQTAEPLASLDAVREHLASAGWEITPELDAVLAQLPLTPEAEDAATSADAEDAPTEAITSAPETPATTPKEDAVAEATAPTLFATEEKSEVETLSKADVFDLIVSAKKTGDTSKLREVDAASSDLFALSDVKTTGANTLGVSTIQSNWLGELWTGDDRTREIVPLFKHADLTAFEVKGFAFGTKPTMTTWTGNKTAIGSPSYTIVTKTAGIQRFAAGYDIAREFFDIAAGRPVIDSFLSKLADSYATVSDDYVLNTVVAALTGTEVVSHAGIDDSWVKIIQGAAKVRAKRARADFAVVAEDVADAMAYTKEDDRLALFNQSVGALGDIKLVVSPTLADGQVLVGDSRAATVFELPGAPIRVNALDIALGGVDEAMFAYVSVLIENTDGLALITDEA